MMAEPMVDELVVWRVEKLVELKVERTEIQKVANWVDWKVDWMAALSVEMMESMTAWNSAALMGVAWAERKEIQLAEKTENLMVGRWVVMWVVKKAECWVCTTVEQKADKKAENWVVVMVEKWVGEKVGWRVEWKVAAMADMKVESSVVLSVVLWVDPWGILKVGTMVVEMVEWKADCLADW